MDKNTDMNAKQHLPKLLVVSPNPDCQGFFISTLKPYFLVSVHQDVDQAIADCERDYAPVIIINQNMPDDDNCRLFQEHSKRLKDKCPALLLTATKDVTFDLAQSEIGVPSQFLNWPIDPKALLDSISYLIGRKAEEGWKDLPPEIGRPLTLSVEEYQSVANAIAEGEPVDCNAAAESCQPLADTVRAGNHHEILNAVRSHHDYTYVHSMRVATLLTLFGHGLGMTGEDLVILSTGGLIHDVGKLVTPYEILDKPDKLDDQEWPVMREHVVHSADILGKSDDVTKGSVIIAAQHHEKIDGSGYPHGLKGKEMNELARMSSIVDIFGALTDARSYKPAYPQEKAFNILESMTREIDQHLLSMFKDIFAPGSELEMQAQAA